MRTCGESAIDRRVARVTTVTQGETPLQSRTWRPVRPLRRAAAVDLPRRAGQPAVVPRVLVRVRLLVPARVPVAVRERLVKQHRDRFLARSSRSVGV